MAKSIQTPFGVGRTLGVAVFGLRARSLRQLAEWHDDSGETPAATGAPESQERASVNVDSIFKKYKKRHVETIAALKEVAETLQRLQKEKKNPPTLILSFAIASELLRLQKEVDLIKTWDSGAIDKGEYATLMAENSFILDQLIPAQDARRVRESK